MDPGIHELCPATISPAEATAGFILAEMEYPHGPFKGRPPTILAVVYRFAVSYRLVKLQYPSRVGHYYNHKVFGTFHLAPPHALPEWHPLRAGYLEDDPVRVTEEAARWVREHPQHHYILRIPPE